jgi:hypothetical protein
MELRQTQEVLRLPQTQLLTQVVAGVVPLTLQQLVAALAALAS